MLVGGPGPGERSVQTGMKKVGKKVMEGFKGSSQEGSGRGAAGLGGDGTTARIGGETMCAPPPSPPPSDGSYSASSSSSSSGESDDESGEKVQGSPFPQPYDEHNLGSETITPPQSNRPAEYLSNSTNSVASGSCVAPFTLAPPLGPVTSSEPSPALHLLDGSLPSVFPEQPFTLEPDELPPLPTQLDIRTRKTSLSGGLLPQNRVPVASSSMSEQPVAGSSGQRTSSPATTPGYFDAYDLNASPSSSAAAVPPPSPPTLTAALNTPIPSPTSVPNPLPTTWTASSGALLHPSSAMSPHPPSGLPRRNTTGSPLAVSSSNPPPRSPQLQKSPSVSSARISSSSSYGHLHPRASSPQTIVPGTDGAHLDSDILAQAEIIRKERLSRRARRDDEDAAAAAAAAAEENAAGVGELNPVASGGATRKSTGGLNREMDEARVLVGNLIGEDHVNYVLMYNMLTGIRIGVSTVSLLSRVPGHAANLMDYACVGFAMPSQDQSTPYF